MVAVLLLSNKMTTNDKTETDHIEIVRMPKNDGSRSSLEEGKEEVVDDSPNRDFKFIFSKFLAFTVSISF